MTKYCQSNEQCPSKSQYFPDWVSPTNYLCYNPNFCSTQLFPKDNTKDNFTKLLKDNIAKWVLDGGLTCITCEPDDNGHLECENDTHLCCVPLSKDIDKLLDILRENGYHSPRDCKYCEGGL